MQRLPQATFRHDYSDEAATGPEYGRYLLQQLLQGSGTDAVDAVEIGKDEIELFIEDGFVERIDVDIAGTDLILKGVLFHFLLGDLQHFLGKIGGDNAYAAFAEECGVFARAARKFQNLQPVQLGCDLLQVSPNPFALELANHGMLEQGTMGGSDMVKRDCHKIPVLSGCYIFRADCSGR